MSEWLRGRSPNTKLDHSKGMLRWNNGISNTSAHECPGEGWKRGMLPRILIR